MLPYSDLSAAWGSKLDAEEGDGCQTEDSYVPVLRQLAALIACCCAVATTNGMFSTRSTARPSSPASLSGCESNFRYVPLDSCRQLSVGTSRGRSNGSEDVRRESCEHGVGHSSNVEEPGGFR